MKHCPTCHETKAITSFGKDLNNVCGLHWECKPCTKIRTKKYAKGGEYQARMYFERHYGDPDKMTKQFEEVKRWLNDQSLYI